MYDRSRRLFVFTRRAGHSGQHNAGHSIRYSAIALIGLASSPDEIPAIDATERRGIRGQLLSALPSAALGDAALIAWATSLTGGTPAAAWNRIAELSTASARHPVVEVAWALAALTLGAPRAFDGLRRSLADRLLSAYVGRGRMFRHEVAAQAGFRSHVTCFADQVYPIHALSHYAFTTGDGRALDSAGECARHLCSLQGDAGQWWWHYDVRRGRVLERYPVYAIHQDAMAPMALMALERAGGPDLHASICRGLQWLAAAPELRGASLIDEEQRMVWRKVGRHEPAKLSRYVQAAASRWRPGRRASWLERLFPPGAVDYEDRPYHWGWLLYAWAGRRHVTGA